VEEKKKTRAKPFSLKELRFSIAYMILWSLLAVVFFTYLTIYLGEKIEQSLIYFLIVVTGYSIIVVILTLIFTHRFLGPFERLKTELRIIRSGYPQRRLSIRSHDDLYVRSFISEVDKLLDEYEKLHLFKEEFREKINSELSNINTLIKRKDVPNEELKEAILSLHKEVEAILKEGRPL
jgi:hypothetical protein